MKILVVGDLILDIYTHCSCERISPEAPVPVLKPISQHTQLGGAANVAACLAALNVQTHCASIIGDDANGQILEQALLKANIKPLLIKESARLTSTKERLLSSCNQVARIDNESTHAISPNSIEALIKLLDDDYDALIISDYAKGVISKELAQAIKPRAKLSLADPKNDLDKFIGFDVITPNIKEAKTFIADCDLSKASGILQALLNLHERFKIKTPMITLSEKGIAALCEDELILSPALASEVYDVTGAGDSVIAALAYALASGFNLTKALQFANKAAAITVSKIGTYACTLAQIHAINNKIISIQTACELSKNHKTVWTNGCFDILHAGHISYLSKAKELGDLLIVGLNSDESVKALKGPSRPINCQEDRAKLLAALECVDYVVVFDELDPIKCLQALKPDVLVKGADYKLDEVLGKEFAKETVLIDFVPNKSSSQIINKCKES